MSVLPVSLLILGILIALVGAIFGRGAYSVFSLAEHKRNPDRFSDHLPWALIVAPGVVFNKNGSFQSTFRFRGPDLDSATESELLVTASQEQCADAPERRLGDLCGLAPAAR